MMLIVALLVTMLVMLDTAGAKDAGTIGDYEDEDSGGDLGNEATTRRTTARVRTTTRPSTPTTGLPPNVTEPRAITPSTTTEQRKSGVLGSLLCTVGEGFTKSTFVFPPDGLCGIVTFDSLYSRSGSTLEPPYKPDLEYFLETARQHRVTEYAIGFDYSFCRNKAKIQQLVADANTKLHLNAMWDQRVYHYGQVSTPLRPKGNSAAGVVEESAKCLQMISNLMNDRKDPMLRPSYTILHFPLHSKRSTHYVVGALRSHPVDVFVFIAYHAESDMYYAKCRMVPPIIRSSQLLPSQVTSEYPIRLDIIISSLVSKRAKWPAETWYALALGMGGRWYVPKNPPTGISLGDECIHAGYPAGKQIGNVSQVCADRNFDRVFYTDPTYEATVRYNDSRNWLFTYESAFSFQSKVCKTKQTAVHVDYTLVATNIQFDDYMNYCFFGSYGRLVMLKTLADFLMRNYTSADKEAACMALR